MALFTHKVTQGYTSPEGTITSVVTPYTGDTTVGTDGTVNATTTNKEFDLAVTKANIVSMMITCDKAVTVKTNSTSTPQDTITLAAGAQIIWANDHNESAFLSSNITKFYVTNPGSSAARFRFFALLNQGV